MINKRRITALEAACKRINAPGYIEYGEASQRMTRRVRERIEARLTGNDYIQTQEEASAAAADDGLIQAYNQAYNIPDDNGAYERIVHKLDIIGKRIKGEL